MGEMVIMKKFVLLVNLLFSIFIFSCENSSEVSENSKNISGNWSGKGIYKETYSLELNLNLVNDSEKIIKNPNQSCLCTIELYYKDETIKNNCYPTGIIRGNKLEMHFNNSLGTSSYSGIINETLDTISGVFSAENLGSVGVSDSDLNLVLVKN